jgi:hypothetical protein
MIYISGKISGMEEEAFILFQQAEKYLIEQGWAVINPMTLPHKHNKSWHAYMREDLRALCSCDEIYMLNNWIDSKGAIIEHTIAMWLGIRVIYQP